MENKLRINSIPYLLNSSEAVKYIAQRDLLNETVPDISEIQKNQEVTTLLKGQNKDGSWGKPGGYPIYHKQMVETFKRLRILVGRYEFNKNHPQIEFASEYLFGTQTLDGDFRGMIGDQYATYYTGEFSSLLIKASYAEDKRIDLALNWLLSMRQNDGGWTVPIQTLPPGGGMKRLIALTGAPSDPIEPDRTKPFSHMGTDMVLRAFAAHTIMRKNPEAIHAACLLKTRFFKEDTYSSYKNKHYWVRFGHWWPNLITSLESLIQFGFTSTDPDIAGALQWFINNQENDGSWKTSYFPGNVVNSKKEFIEREWITLRILKILKYFHFL